MRPPRHAGTAEPGDLARCARSDGGFRSPSATPPIAPFRPSCRRSRLSNTTNPLVAVTNGYAVKTGDGERLGGAEPILVKWSGVLARRARGRIQVPRGRADARGRKARFRARRKIAVAGDAAARLEDLRGPQPRMGRQHASPKCTSPACGAALIRSSSNTASPRSDFSIWISAPQAHGLPGQVCRARQRGLPRHACPSIISIAITRTRRSIRESRSCPAAKTPRHF